MSFDFDIDAEEEWFDDSAPIYDFPNLKKCQRYFRIPINSTKE